MAGFDYGNARLRAMKARLLTRRELESHLEAGSLQGLIGALTKTSYRRAVETSLTRVSGMNAIVETLRIDLIKTIGAIPSFYSESTGKMVGIVLRTYDIHNLKAILRGLSKNSPASEILEVLLPVGELDLGTLRELASAPGPRGAIDLMASMNLPFSKPLLKLRAENPGAELFEMELALDRWHYLDAHKFIKEEARSVDLLTYALNMDADIANILTSIRFVLFPEERKMLREQFREAGLEDLFFGPGKLPYSTLIDGVNLNNLEGFIGALSVSPYEPALREGLVAYQRSTHLSEFERVLQRYRSQWMSSQLYKDPLGIGVVLGYIALKVNETNNIRWIAQGIQLGLSVEAIRNELEYMQ